MKIEYMLLDECKTWEHDAQLRKLDKLIAIRNKLGAI